MALAFPQAREAHAFDAQYLFGPDLLVAPVLQASGAVTVWLPEGLWWDWHQGTRHRGPVRLELVAPPDGIPMFARDGAEIPLARPAPRAAAWGDDGPIELAEMRSFG